VRFKEEDIVTKLADKIYKTVTAVTNNGEKSQPVCIGKAGEFQWKEIRKNRRLRKELKKYKKLASMNKIDKAFLIKYQLEAEHLKKQVETLNTFLDSRINNYRTDKYILGSEFNKDYQTGTKAMMEVRTF
jgi:hypothetical protein